MSTTSPPADGPNPTRPETKEGLREHARYQDILPDYILRYMSVLSFSVAVVMLLYWSFSPERLDSKTGRAVAGLLIGTLFAVFFFVFYPDHLEIHLPNVLGTTVRLAGPIVLFVVVTWLVLYFLGDPPAQKEPPPPLPATWVRFQVLKDGQPTVFLRLTGTDETSLMRTDGQPPPEYRFGASQDGRPAVESIFVLFPQDVSEIPVILHHKGWAEDLPFTLTRAGRAIDISKARDRF